MAPKSDKMKKKMAMMAREREEFEQQKLAMQEDMEYMKKEESIHHKLSYAESCDGDDSNTLVRRHNSKGDKKGDVIRKYGTADEGDSARHSPMTSTSSRRRRRTSSLGSGSGSHSKMMQTAARNASTTSNSDANLVNGSAPVAHPIPTGKKISDWCYTASADSTPPVVKGHQDLYIDVRFIGRGAFGTVDLVKNKEDSKLYAVKTMLVQNKKDMTEFLHEVQYLRNRHPFIIHLHDVFITTSPKKVFLVMHYCEGGDLGKVISAAVKSRNHIPESSISKWFCQICLAVNFLHELRIVHRDIKPQNILLSDNGDVAQLADFGLAIKLDDDAESFASCEVGTPYYTAPEMIKSEPCSFPVDDWSLGIVLFESLALEMPFDGDDTMGLVKSILNNECRLDRIPHEIYTPDLLEILECLLRKDPTPRMTSGQVLTSPGILSKASHLPLQYRPKYLEERLKRAHVKQMTRQLESLGVHCASSTPAASHSATPTVLSPVNSVRRVDANLSPVNSISRQASSPRSVPHHPRSSGSDDSQVGSPRFQYESVELHLQPPKMKSSKLHQDKKHSLPNVESANDVKNSETLPIIESANFQKNSETVDTANNIYGEGEVAVESSSTMTTSTLTTSTSDLKPLSSSSSLSFIRQEIEVRTQPLHITHDSADRCIENENSDPLVDIIHKTDVDVLKDDDKSGDVGVVKSNLENSQLVESSKNTICLLGDQKGGIEDVANVDGSRNFETTDNNEKVLNHKEVSPERVLEVVEQTSPNSKIVENIGPVHHEPKNDNPKPNKTCGGASSTGDDRLTSLPAISIMKVSSSSMDSCPSTSSQGVELKTSIPSLPELPSHTVKFKEITSPRKRSLVRRHSAHSLVHYSKRVVTGVKELSSVSSSTAIRRCKSGTTRTVEVVFLNEGAMITGVDKVSYSTPKT